MQLIEGDGIAGTEVKMGHSCCQMGQSLEEQRREAIKRGDYRPSGRGWRGWFSLFCEWLIVLAIVLSLSKVLWGGEPESMYAPTPPDVVVEMLRLAEVTKDDVVFDLGCGDGRIVVAAAATFGCEAVGVELDEQIAETARRNVKRNGLQEKVEIRSENALETSLSDATVVMLYVLEPLGRRLRPRLEGLRDGTRVVAHEHPVPGWSKAKPHLFFSRAAGQQKSIYVWKIRKKKERVKSCSTCRGGACTYTEQVVTTVEPL